MSNYAASLQPKDKKPTKRFGQPLTIDQLQDSDRSAAAALAACPALEVTLLMLNREVHGDQDQVLTYSRRKRKQLWGFDRGPRKRPAEADGALHCQPEPPEELPEDADDGVDWDKAVEEEERRPRAVRQYGTDDYRMEFEDDSDCLVGVWVLLTLLDCRSTHGAPKTVTPMLHPCGTYTWTLSQSATSDSLQLTHLLNGCFMATNCQDIL